MPAFSSGFDCGYDAEGCDEEEQPVGGGGVGILIPSAVPNIRKRKRGCVYGSGEGWITVIGVGKPTAEPSKKARDAEREADDEDAILAAVHLLLQQRSTTETHAIFQVTRPTPGPSPRFRTLHCTTCNTDTQFHARYAQRMGGRWACTQCGYPE